MGGKSGGRVTCPGSTPALRQMFSSSGACPGAAEKIVGKLGWLPSDLEVPRAEGNRMRYSAAAFCNHLALGSSFSFSMWLSSLTKIDGVVAQAGTDWAMGQVTPAFSLIMGGFVWAGVFGGLQQQIGARASCLIGAAGIGSGFALMGLACEMHSIPLLLTAAAIQGLGNGSAYVLLLLPSSRGFQTEKAWLVVPQLVSLSSSLSSMAMT